MTFFISDISATFLSPNDFPHETTINQPLLKSQSFIGRLVFDIGEVISHLYHRIEITRRATRVGTFEVCVSTHVALRMLIMQVLASQLPFLANRNAEQAVPPLFWPVNCIKIGRHVALLSGPSVYVYSVSLWPVPSMTYQKCRNH